MFGSIIAGLAAHSLVKAYATGAAMSMTAYLVAKGKK